MSEAGRLRYLLVAVTLLATILVIASRRIGRPGGLDEAVGRRVATAAEEAGRKTGKAGAVAPAAPDLSFYEELGVPRGGRPDAAGSLQRRLAPSDREAPPGGAYVVQVLSTRDETQVERMRKQLRALGLPAEVIEEDLDGHRIFRLWAGRYRERKTAVAWAERIRKEMDVDPWVLQEAE